MATLKIDPTTSDLMLTNNTLVIETDISAETEQRLKAKLRTFLGEWFRDLSIGIPYFQEILVKNPNLPRIKAIFREMILADEQVDRLENPVSFKLDRSTREMTVVFTAKLNDGTFLDFSEAILAENL